MIAIGTSGFSYTEWKGSFYPEKMPASRMLPYYAERLSTVEINNTFYRFPTEKLLDGWSATTPDGFTFTLKAPRRITHVAKLRDCADEARSFCERALTLGPKLGVLLFQLPPYLRKDAGLLGEFVESLPEGVRAAFEFRHRSWHSDDVFDTLRAGNLALCIADSETLTTPVVATADYGYLRLRDEGYREADFAGWADTIRRHEDVWGDTFVYFKHEEKGTGPEFARALEQSLAGRAAPN